MYEVIDALKHICWYTAICHLLKGFLPKFQILSWNIVAHYYKQVECHIYWVVEMHTHGMIICVTQGHAFVEK
jgi:hypothetical protein